MELRKVTTVVSIEVGRLFLLFIRNRKWKEVRPQDRQLCRFIGLMDTSTV